MKKLSTIFIILLFTINTYGNWTKYTAENSRLPGNVVYDIVVDSKNNIWFAATRDGLAKFDGNNWKVYNKENSDITVGNIKSVAVDQNDNLWIGGSSNFPGPSGITFFNGKDWTYYNNVNNEINIGQVNNIAINENNNPVLATLKHLKIFNGANWEVIDHGPDELPASTVDDVEIDKNNNIWFIVDLYGLFQYSNGELINYNTDNSDIPSNRITSIAIDSSNNIWLSMFKGELIKYNYTDNIWEEIDLSGTPITRRGYLFFDRYNNLWVSNINKVIKYDGFNYEVHSIDSLTDTDIGLGPMCIDKEGNLWAATNSYGVFKLSGAITNVENKPKSNKLNLYPNPAENTINIELEDLQVVNYKVTNISGKVLTESKGFFKNNIEVNIQDFATGTYFIELTTQSGDTIKEKFVKE